MLDIILKIIKTLFLTQSKANSEKRPESANIESKIKIEKPAEIAIVHKEYITLQDWITSSGRFPDRAKSSELTEEVLSNAKDLIRRVNALLTELGWNEKVSISSGFRPSGVNANVQGAAKRSAHMTGKALDIMQPKDHNKLGKIIRETQKELGANGILGKNGLMMEFLESTVGTNTSWVHLDTVKRPVRPSMEFKP